MSILGYEPIDDSYHILKSSSPEEIYFKIYGYKYNSGRLFIYHVFSILLLGIPYLIVSLYPKYGVIKFKRCGLQTAEFILSEWMFIVLKIFHDTLFLVGSGHGNYTILPIYTENINLPNIGPFELRHFEFQHNKYFWNSDEWCFTSVDRLTVAETLEEILEHSRGCTDIERHNL